MLQRFGEAVRQYLQGAWQAAMRTSEVGAINPQGTGKRGGVLQATERASRSKGSLDKRADAPQSLFTYDARPLNKLTAGERDTLRVLRGLAEHQGHSIIPVRVTSLSRSKGGPRRIETLTEAAYGWTGAFAALFKKTAFFYDGPPILNGAVADSPPHTPSPRHVQANSTRPLQKLFPSSQTPSHPVSTPRPGPTRPAPLKSNFLAEIS